MHDIEKIHELDVIELTEDLPQYGLKQGAQGAVLEVLDEPELAYVLEFVGEDGTSSRVAYAVRPDQLRKVTSGTSQDSSSENESNIKKPDAIEITVDEPRERSLGNRRKSAVDLRELEKQRRIRESMGIDDNTLRHIQEQHRILASTPWREHQEITRFLRNDLAHSAAARFAELHNTFNSPLFDLAREANSSVVHMLEKLQRETGLAAQIGTISSGWGEQLRVLRQAHDVTMKDVLGAHIGRISEMSLLAQATLGEIQQQHIGDIFRISDEVKATLSSKFFDFSSSYKELIGSFEESQANILALSPTLSGLPTVEYYTGARLLRATTIVQAPEQEVEEESEEVSEKIASETDDALENLLADLDPQFIQIRRGAKQALTSDNPDRVRHFSASLRELFTHILHRLAPDDEVRAWNTSPDYYGENGRPTRQARLLYITRGINQEPFVTFVKKDVAAALEFLNLFQRGTHEVVAEYTPAQLTALELRMESMIRFMLEIARFNK